MVATVGRKRLVALPLRVLPVAPAMRVVAKRRRLVGILNLHSVPERYGEAFGGLLDHLQKTFAIGNPFVLEETAGRGGTGPTLFLTFDDGLANHAEVVAPELEARGLRAIFSLPVAFLDAPHAEQLRWFRERVYPEPTELHADSDIRAMTWDQANALAERGHRLCSHGVQHARLDGDVSADLLEREVVQSRRLLTERVPTAVVDGFCWPIRAGAGAADELVRKTYRYALVGSTRPLVAPHDLHCIYRANVEVSWRRSEIDLQLARLALR